MKTTTILPGRKRRWLLLVFGALFAVSAALSGGSLSELRRFEGMSVLVMREASGEELLEPLRAQQATSLWALGARRDATLQNEDGKAVEAALYAVTAGWETLHGVRMARGRFAAEAGAIALRSDLAVALFGREDCVGREVRSGGRSYFVSGIYDKEAGSASPQAEGARAYVGFDSWPAGQATYFLLTEGEAPGLESERLVRLLSPYAGSVETQQLSDLYRAGALAMRLAGAILLLALLVRFRRAVLGVPRRLLAEMRRDWTRHYFAAWLRRNAGRLACLAAYLAGAAALLLLFLRGLGTAPLPDALLSGGPLSALAWWADSSAALSNDAMLGPTPFPLSLYAAHEARRAAIFCFFALASGIGCLGALRGNPSSGRPTRAPEKADACRACPGNRYGEFDHAAASADQGLAIQAQGDPSEADAQAMRAAASRPEN